MRIANYWLGFKSILQGAAMPPKVSKFTSNIHQTKPIISRKHRPDYSVVMIMVLLMMIGLVLIYAIGPQKAVALNRVFGSNDYSEIYFFKKQLFSIVIALIGFFICSSLSFKLVKKHLIWFIILVIFSAILLFLITLVPILRNNFAVCTMGACRWLSLKGRLTIQVSEVMKIGSIVFFAGFWGYLAQNNRFNSLDNLKYSLPIIILIEFFIVVLQNDLGTGVSLFGILLLMAWIAGLKIEYFIITLFLVLIAGGGMIALKPHRVARVKTFLSGAKSESNAANHHSIQAKIAIGSGGLFGLGIGNSVQSTGYLPEAINDSIFAIIGEVFGFIGNLAIISLFAFLIYRLLIDLTLSQEYFLRLLIAGSIAWIFSHFIINTFSMIGLIPITGITLPFLSYGGTSMLFVASALGLAFNASRYTAHAKTNMKGYNR